MQEHGAWLGLTHVTRLCCPLGMVWSTGFLPVSSSSSITPKLYTSLLCVNTPVIAYLWKRIPHVNNNTVKSALLLL